MCAWCLSLDLCLIQDVILSHAWCSQKWNRLQTQHDSDKDIGPLHLQKSSSFYTGRAKSLGPQAIIYLHTDNRTKAQIDNDGLQHMYMLKLIFYLGFKEKEKYYISNKHPDFWDILYIFTLYLITSMLQLSSIHFVFCLNALWWQNYVLTYEDTVTKFLRNQAIWIKSARKDKRSSQIGISKNHRLPNFFCPPTDSRDFNLHFNLFPNKDLWNYILPGE